MRMTVLEKGVRDKIDVNGYPDCEGGEIVVNFPNPHVEVTLDLQEAENTAVLIMTTIQEVKLARERKNEI